MQIGKINFGETNKDIKFVSDTDWLKHKNDKEKNPWEMQDKLMEISSQSRPEIYELNNSSILYVALILEEVSELLLGIEKVLEETYDIPDALYDIVRSARSLNHDHSLELRDELKLAKPFEVQLTKDEAIEIADATTDIAVVNCGFAISSGIDGNACYQEVASSNLSKANPETGVIDKDGSGKWIKGSNYFEPCLERVLYG